jgi:hypothetical protein
MEEMMRTMLLAAAAVTVGVLSLSQSARAADEFWVVQDTSTKKCTVVDKKPTTTTTVVVGEGTAYKTRTEAETSMKSVKVCSN